MQVSQYTLQSNGYNRIAALILKGDLKIDEITTVQNWIRDQTEGKIYSIPRVGHPKCNDDYIVKAVESEDLKDRTTTIISIYKKVNKFIVKTNVFEDNTKYSEEYLLNQ